RIAVDDAHRVPGERDELPGVSHLASVDERQSRCLEHRPLEVRPSEGMVGDRDDAALGHSNMRSSCSMRVKTTGPSFVTRTSSSRRTVCCKPGCPAKVSM